MSRHWRQNQVFRLLATLLLANGVIVGAELVLSVGLALLLISGTAPPGHWTFLLTGAVTSGIFAGQLLMLWLVGALVEKARWSMWLAVMPFALLLSIAFLALQIGPGAYFFARMRDPGGALEMIVLLSGVVPLTLCYGGLLVLSIVLWPLKVFSGWGAAWSDRFGAVAGKVPISHLMMWVGLWGALFLLATTLSEAFGIIAMAGGIAGLVFVLLTGLPVALLVSGDRWSPQKFAAVVALVLFLSFAESELVYWLVKPPGLTSFAPVMAVVMPFNASLAGIITLNCSLLRRQGLRLHMPIGWKGVKSPFQNSAVAPTNS